MKLMEVEGGQQYSWLEKTDSLASYNSPGDGTFQCMPTLRELTETIQRCPGVRAVVILGADGLVIEMHHTGHDNAESLAARVPAVATAARHLGEAAHAGDTQLVLLEWEDGYGVILRLSSQAMLFVSTGLEVALADLLFDLRRHRAPMSALV
jgi:predicted regulator of Ras-like GTPase activity (Roadblock/LC7/MglB family)